MLTIHFFEKVKEKVCQENENGHFKNVQNENFQNTFTNYFFIRPLLLEYYLSYYNSSKLIQHLPPNMVTGSLTSASSSAASGIVLGSNAHNHVLSADQSMLIPLYFLLSIHRIR